MKYSRTSKGKPLTYEQALNRLAALCSRGEHSSAEARQKAMQWQLSDSDTERIIDYLIDEKYIDDKRFCIAYAKDKLRYNHWGRLKISQMLRMQGLPAECIREGLEGIDEEEYQNILTKVISAKKLSLNSEDDYTRNNKILRHAASKGFESDLIIKLLPDYED